MVVLHGLLDSCRIVGVQLVSQWGFIVKFIDASWSTTKISLCTDVQC